MSDNGNSAFSGGVLVLLGILVGGALIYFITQDDTKTVSLPDLDGGPSLSIDTEDGSFSVKGD